MQITESSSSSKPGRDLFGLYLMQQGNRIEPHHISCSKNLDELFHKKCYKEALAVNKQSYFSLIESNRGRNGCAKHAR